AHLPGRLEPVVVDVDDLRIFRHHLGQLQRDLAHLRYLWTTDAVLDRPADRRAEFKRGDAADQVGKIIGQHFFELDPYAPARGDVLGDDHGLAEEVIRKLHV